MKIWLSAFLLVCLLPLTTLVAQTIDSVSKFTVDAYVETYYCYDVNKPADNTRQSFFYSHNRHNEFNLNLGFIRVAMVDSNYRANLALMAGTYTNANLAAEPSTLKNIMEANAGFRIPGKSNLWVDVGVFSSHIGFESAIGANCWNVTRSILADNSPYYESGIRLSGTSKNEKWNFGLYVLNGWQRIQRVPGNSLPSFGSQISFSPSERITMNSSTFAGTDKPDSIRLMRYFHNLYVTVQASARFAFITGFDVGAEQKSRGSTSYNLWYSPVLIGRYTINSKFTAAIRGEYYNDAKSVLITTSTLNGFQTFGYSANLDYKLLGNTKLRIEARGLNSKDAIFFRDGRQVNDDYFFTAAICVSF